MDHRDARAARYELATPVRYRVAGGQWHEGRAINMSGTGILFQAEGPVLPPATLVEVVVALSPPGGAPAAVAGCTGRIARTVAGQPAGGAAMAATIETYELLPATEINPPAAAIDGA